MVNAKKKGNRGEQVFAQWLRENGIKGYKDSASGGGNGEKGDITNDIGFTFEVKTVKQLNLKKAWDQVDKSSGANRAIPCLAIHFDGMDKNTWLTVMHSEDWISFIQNDTQSDYLDPKFKYALTGLKNAITSVLKFIK